MQFASSLRLNPFVAVYVRVQKHGNRVMGYRLCQLILCHNNILEVNGLTPLIGDCQSAIVSNVC